MLWIYAGIHVLEAAKLAVSELPAHHIDISKVSLEDISKSVQDVYNHHPSGHIYLGYLDPLLMLHPTDEAKLRKGFEKFDMSVVVSNPLILPVSWKNGTSRLRVIEAPFNHANGTKTLNDGGAPHIQHEAEHRGASTQIADKRDTDKGGETGSAPKRRKQKRQNKETKP